MPVRIDQPRNHGVAVRDNLVAAFRGLQIRSDLRDQVVGDAHVGGEQVLITSVEDLRPSDDDIVIFKRGTVGVAMHDLAAVG